MCVIQVGVKTQLTIATDRILESLNAKMCGRRRVLSVDTNI